MQWHIKWALPIDFFEILTDMLYNRAAWRPFLAVRRGGTWLGMPLRAGPLCRGPLVIPLPPTYHQPVKTMETSSSALPVAPGNYMPKKARPSLCFQEQKESPVTPLKLWALRSRRGRICYNLKSSLNLGY